MHSIFFNFNNFEINYKLYLIKLIKLKKVIKTFFNIDLKISQTLTSYNLVTKLFMNIF